MQTKPYQDAEMLGKTLWEILRVSLAMLVKLHCTAK